MGKRGRGRGRGRGRKPAGAEAGERSVQSGRQLFLLAAEAVERDFYQLSMCV